jgi:pantoate--beta-alanine ligase
MKIIENINEMHQVSLKNIISHKTIGFVPTMGALHEGHLSLVREARRENDITVVSIFVNPTQFGPNEDFDKYPRTFEDDCELLRKEKTDYLFYPSTEGMYGKNFETTIDLKILPNHLCGLSRPGHFQGVATIVAKLFNIIRPDIAYFGQKDYQQAQIIKKITDDLNFFIDIRIMPIIREAGGLALSSRNRYLSQREKEEASNLYKALLLGKKLIMGGENNSNVIIKKLEEYITLNIHNVKIDYISVADTATLSEIKLIENDVIIALAVFIGSTRLIDNIIVKINLSR